MYFPYLRGKQFELLALRALVLLMAANRAKISPIIEPVKNTSTLINTLSDLRKSNINFSIIINPSVGDLISNPQEVLNVINSKLNGYNNFQIGILVKPNADYEILLELIDDYKVLSAGFTFIHNDIEDDIAILQNDFNNLFPILNNVIDFKKTNRRYYRNFPAETRVSLDDYFAGLTKNSDYLNQESQFSEEHKFYKEDGFKGFSDFLTIGDNYSDTGFLPYAVAIHISYEDDAGRIRVNHFVSDSNDDNSDVAGKFAEANRKLVDWCDEKGLNTIAINEFRNLYENGHFPGLGIIKKLSIMNHIELVLNLI
jgi:hypothetical protein